MAIGQHCFLLSGMTDIKPYILKVKTKYNINEAIEI